MFLVDWTTANILVAATLLVIIIIPIVALARWFSKGK